MDSESNEQMDMPLPTEKLHLPPSTPHEVGNSDSLTRCDMQKCVVLVAMGSFNPPTYMHMRMFELARDALNSKGYFVMAGYISPVNDAYAKKGLLSAKHRIKLCKLASRSSSFVMVDSWEARQSSYQRSLMVLTRIQSSLCESGVIDKESLKVMLLCGSDLVESFSVPGAWIRDQVRIICREFGIVCIRREGKDMEKIICGDAILNENKDNIVIVDELVPNQISSTRVRDCIKKGLSIKYLTEDDVVAYIKEQQLYLN